MALKASLSHKTAFFGPIEKIMGAVNMRVNRSNISEYQTYFYKRVYHALNNSTPVIQPSHDCSLGLRLYFQVIACNSAIYDVCGTGAYSLGSESIPQLILHSLLVLHSMVTAFGFVWSQMKD